MKYLRAAALFLAFQTAGCTGFDEQPSGGEPFEGRTVKTKISLRTAPELDGQGREIPITRAPLDITETEESAIHNVWVFQFAEPESGGGDDSRPFLRSVYIDDQTLDTANAGTGTMEVDLIDSGGREHLLVFVANVNEADYKWLMNPGRNTYADLKSRYYHLDNNVIFEDSRSWGAEWRNFIMSGSVKSVVDDQTPITGASGQPVPLTRSLAKLQFELTLGNPDYEITYVKLRNVPDRIWFTESLNEHPKFDSLNLIDFPIDIESGTGGIIGVNSTKKYMWYVPPQLFDRNEKIASLKQRHTYAPTYAVHIEIVAKNVNTGKSALYRIYPGADMKDFNIRANHHYIVRQTIQGDGGDDLDDSRIEQFDDVVLSGFSNSFILNPPVSDIMAARTYHIPISRVNQYWAPAADEYPGYGGLLEGAILSSTRWRVDLLWQDNKDMVRATSDIPTRIYLSKVEGKGPRDSSDPNRDAYFSITVPYGAIHGNFVMIIRAYDPNSHAVESQQTIRDVVLWSWHFWVTDYNPGRAKELAVHGDEFIYKVPGGQVERYGGAAWGYDTPGAAVHNNWNNYEYNTASTAPYAREFMMDRPLGALNKTLINNERTVPGMLLYQFGRKDPFPTLDNIYNISGSTISSSGVIQAQRWNSQAWQQARAVTVAESVNYPMWLFGIQSSRFFWASIDDNDDNTLDNNYVADYIWLDSKLQAVGAAPESIRSYNGKSIFDPCPAGWKIPTLAAWEDFRRDDTGHTVNIGESSSSGGSISDYRVFPTERYTRFYWPNVEIDGNYPVKGFIRFHRLMHRNNNSGILTADGPKIRRSSNNVSDDSGGSYWQAVPDKATEPAKFSLTTFTSYDYITASYGYANEATSVRCISTED
jgi:hypothetical protein